MTNHAGIPTTTTKQQQQQQHHQVTVTNHKKWAIATKLRIVTLLLFGTHLISPLLLQQELFPHIMEEMRSSSSTSSSSSNTSSSGHHDEKKATTTTTTSDSSSSATTNTNTTTTCRLDHNNNSAASLLQSSKEKRLGNIHMTREEWAEQYKLLSSPSLLHHIDSLMGQTLAWPESRLVQSKQDDILIVPHHHHHHAGDNGLTATTAAAAAAAAAAWERRWLTRLSFAVIYLHQHGPAREQCKKSSSSTSSSSSTEEDIESCMASRLQQHGIGQWDWECGPNQKYLLFSQQDQGLGAGVILFRQAMVAGIASQRIVLPINNVATAAAAAAAVKKKTDLGNAWTMASCPRQDMQCVFAPTSPCVLTMDQIYNGTLLETKQDFYRLFYKGEPPSKKPYMNDTQVLWQSYNNFGLRDDKENNVFFDRVYTLAQQLLAELPLVQHDSNDNDPKAATRRASIWQRTAELYVTNQTLAMECFHKAINMYVLRPNAHYHKQLREMLQSNMPSSQQDYDPQQTIGLPIRATDKCSKESSCLSFDQYMELALETWKQQQASSELSNKGSLSSLSKQVQRQQKPPPPPHVIVTSEAKEIYQQLRQLMADPVKSVRYPFRFVMNDNDVQPGTGRFRVQKQQKGGGDNNKNTTITTIITADDGMVSALSTLQLQLGTGLTRANCCSSFHKIMGVFLSVSGGGALENDFQCLNDQSTDPRFRICCWKGGSCMEKRNKDLEQWEKNNNQLLDERKESESLKNTSTVS